MVFVLGVGSFMVPSGKIAETGFVARADLLFDNLVVMLRSVIYVTFRSQIIAPVLCRPLFQWGTGKPGLSASI